MNASVLTIARIDESVPADIDAVWVTAAEDAKLARTSTGGTPLPQVLAGLIEHHDAIVAVAVGEIDRAALSGHGVGGGIDVDVSDAVETGAALIQARFRARRIEAIGPPEPGLASRRFGCWVDTVTDALLTNLQQQTLAVVRPFLDDAVAVASNPDVVLVVDETPVDAVGKHRSRPGWAERGVAPAVDEVACRIELEHGR